MANPVLVDCPADTWTLIASGVTGGRINRIRKGGKPSPFYLWTYRDIGGDAPTDREEGIVLFDKDDNEKIEFNIGVDYYVYSANASGRVRLDNFVPTYGEMIGGDPVKIPADQYFSITNGDPTTLNADAVVDTYTLSVTDPSTFSIGDVIIVYAQAAFYSGKILAVVGNTITTDSLINYAFTAGSPAISLSREMNVDGSATPVVFQISLPPGGNLKQINICRFMMVCLTSTAVDLSKFGDIAGGLPRGLLLRGVPNPLSGIPISNNWSIKTNAELALYAYDWAPQDATNPAQGQDGFFWRYSWGGEEKHDVIPPVNAGDALQIVVQDDLTSLELLNIMYQGNYQVEA